MTKVIAAAASFVLIASAASASPLYIDIHDGSVFDFSAVAVGSTKRVSAFYFGIGDLGRDESLNWTIGPEFNLISGSSDAFFFDTVSCFDIGIGAECSANAVFTPNSVGDFISVFEISAYFNFTEIHGEEYGQIYEYYDAFQVSFLGTGVTDVAAVPLPPAAAGSLAALGLLGWFGRKRREIILRKGRT